VLVESAAQRISSHVVVAVLEQLQPLTEDGAVVDEAAVVEQEALRTGRVDEPAAAS